MSPSVPTGWHVSRTVDLLAYHLSWVPALAALWLSGHYGGRRWVLSAIIAVNFAHQVFALPYAFTDARVRIEHRGLLLVTAGLFVSAPILISPRFLDPMVGIAVVWQLWHFLCQKFGILRMYAGKAPQEARPPRWVDRLVVCSWLPLMLVHYSSELLGPIMSFSARSAPIVTLVMIVLVRIRAVVDVPLWMLFGFSVLAFVGYELRGSPRLTPRLVTLLALVPLAFSLARVPPVDVLWAFGFQHGIEYMVFVGAFQKRRYRGAETQVTAWARMWRKPAWPYAFVGGLLCAGLLVESEVGRPARAALQLLGASADRWCYAWVIMASISHFLLDGSLWKMRRPDVRRFV
jgi:hypothetical protein